MEKKQIIANCKADILDNRTIRFTGSDETRDRVGEVIEVSGWETTQYMKNPVFLWAHNYDQPPIGKANAVYQDGKALKFDIEFAPAEVYPFADTIYKLYKGGYLSAVSVGFIPRDQTVDTETYDRKTHEAELLELSAVPVPCNPNALMNDFRRALEKKDITDEEYKTLENIIEPENKPENEPEKKEGRVLSKKNEEVVKKSITAMQEAIKTLSDMLDELEKNSDDTEIKNLYNDILHFSTKLSVSLMDDKDISNIKSAYKGEKNA